MQRYIILPYLAILYSVNLDYCFIERTSAILVYLFVRFMIVSNTKKPRFNFVMLVLSLLLAAGALSKMRKSLRDIRPEMKKTAFK